MNENLGCLVKGHHPTDYGICYDYSTGRYSATCGGCKEKIWIDTEGDHQWKLI